MSVTESLLSWLFKDRDLRGSSKGDIDIDVDVDAEVDVDIDTYVGCLKGVSKSVQVILNGKEAVMVILK